MTGGKQISRRAALARLGLGATGIYVAPSLVGLSGARASTVSAASAATSPSPASEPSPVSAPSAASPASGPSSPANADRSSGSTSTRVSEPRTSASRPSLPGGCQRPSLSGNAQISRRDYQRAQRAIALGEARPLREVLKNVQAKHPGKVLQVGFSGGAGKPAFQVRIVDPSGAVISVSVDAGSGLVTSLRKC